MLSYIVKRTTEDSICKDVPFFEITNFYRLDHYKPITKGQLILREGIGFEFVMWCFESNPRAIYHNPNDPVHTDSCMEGFINFYPELPQLGYLSVEMNANAASHCSFGTGRYTRSFVVERNLPHPEVKVEFLQLEGAPVWRASTIIQLSLLEALYGRSDFQKGHKMRANFYKCGDHATLPHWGTWNPISRLDFHNPESFGELVIE